MHTSSYYSEFAENDRDANARWFRHCSSKSLPFVAVLVGRKYATLSYDCITVNAERDAAIRGPESTAICRSLFSLFQDCVETESGKPMFTGTAFVGTIERLDPSKARTLADQIFTVLNNAAQGTEPGLPQS
jgi:hypothetical protein